jgi:hypothetical protein
VKSLPKTTATRRALHRWPVVVVLACFFLVTATVSWIGHRIEPTSSSWEKTQAYWEEPDLRRLIETYRYRHGYYPLDLTELDRDNLPIAPATLGRWQYMRQNQSYTLSLR